MTSWIVAAGILAIVGIASAKLLFDGLAARLAGHGHAADERDLGVARAKLVAGALGLAVVLWTALGMLTRAR